MTKLFSRALSSGRSFRITRSALPRHYFQVMIVNYLGELKTLLYFPILRVFHPSVWSLRLPAVFLSMGTIVLTWLYTRRVAGNHAAAIAAILLAADPSFLLTGTLDWGPVDLQHLLLMTGLVSLLRWAGAGRSSRTSLAWLALAFFAWGLGFWDKALFVWPLSGLAVAALCVYPRHVFSRIRLREIAVALAALLTGAFPLIAYNATHRGATASLNANFSLKDSATKVDALQKTLNGSILFDMLATPPAPHNVTPSSAWERASERLAQATGDHHRTGFLWLIGIAICLGIFAVNWRERRQMIFLLLAMTIAFLQMLITVGAGGAAHHIVLLWPFPVVFCAIPFGALASARFRVLRYASVAVVVVLFGQELLTVNQYLAAFAADGFPVIWTDAIYRLSDAVRARGGTRFTAVDWGYDNSLAFLSAGRDDFDGPWECLARSAAARESDCGVPALLTVPGLAFIQHTPKNEVFPDVNEHLQRIAAANGYSPVVDHVIADSHGRPVFQIIHFGARFVRLPPRQL